MLSGGGRTLFVRRIREWERGVFDVGMRDSRECGDTGDAEIPHCVVGHEIH